METPDRRFSARDSAFSMTLPFGEEGGVRSVSICDRIFFLSRSKTVEVVTADVIDKDRKNPHVPHINRVLFNFGVQDDFVNRVLIQYDVLAGHVHPPRTSSEYQSLTLDLALLLSQVEKTYREASAEAKSLEEAVQRWTASARGMVISDPIPQATNVANNLRTLVTETNAVIDKIEHFLRKKLSPDVLKSQPSKKPFFDFFVGLEEDQLAATQEIQEGIRRLLPFFKHVKRARNALLHPDEHKSLKYLDCYLDHENKIIMPTVELMTGGEQMRVGLLEFFDTWRQNIFISAQEIVALIGFAEIGKPAKYGLKFFPSDPQNGNAPLYRFTIQFSDGRELPIG